MWMVSEEAEALLVFFVVRALERVFFDGATVDGVPWAASTTACVVLALVALTPFVLAPVAFFPLEPAVRLARFGAAHSTLSVSASLARLPFLFFSVATSTSAVAEALTCAAAQRADVRVPFATIAFLGSTAGRCMVWG